MALQLVIFAGVAALVAVAAFVAGRKTSPEKNRAESIQKELDATQDELNQVRDQINGHFEQSTRLFGRLAEDYRALYEHFSDSAVKLGFLEGEDTALLELSDPLLLPELEGEGEGAPKPDEDPGADDETLRAREAQA